MSSQFAFTWRPGVLEWMLVVELVALLVMAVYRYVAALLGRTAPTDPLVIFYRVFWQALRIPKRFPIPVNYQPVPPKKPKPRIDDVVEGMGLTDDELDALMAGDPGALAADPADAVSPGGGHRGDASTDETRAARSGSSDQGEGLGGTQQVLVEVTITTAKATGIRGLQGGRIVIGVEVPPDDGRANQIAIRQICTLLRVQPHQVAIQAGHTKADKTLRVSGISAGQFSDRLSILGRDPEETLGFRAGS